MNWLSLVNADVKDAEVDLIFLVEVEPTMHDGVGLKDFLKEKRLQGISTGLVPIFDNQVFQVFVFVHHVLANVDFAFRPKEW